MGASISSLQPEFLGDINNRTLLSPRFNITLNAFEQYYLQTLVSKFQQKAEKIANPTRQFSYPNDDNIFVGLSPWTSPTDFGTMLHTLIGYTVRFRNPDDTLYLNSSLAANLYNSIVILYEHLPIPAPHQQAPWGPVADWYHFSITMPECVQSTCIVLRDFYDISAISLNILDAYLPSPISSLGWRRTAGNAIRMCLPYCYKQLLRGYTANQIANERDVQYVLQLIAFHLVQNGNGIHNDYTYFDHGNVRAYGYLINSYFTFSYYNFLFGYDTVNMYNLYYALSLVGSQRGLANPAVLSRQGANFSNVLGNLIQYSDGVVSADFSKILTVRNANYFGSIVGQAKDIAYYEADPTNNTHAPLWTMTRKIWPNSSAIVRYRPNTIPFESGIILIQNLNNPVTIETTTTSTSSFLPSLAYTAICTTTNAGAMAMHVRLEELNLEFHSYTLYHRFGMFHMYDNIKTLRHISFNPRCVVMVRDLQQDTDEPRWTTASNTKTYNKTVAKHHNILNNAGLSNFVIRTVDSSQVQLLEQIVSADAVNRGVGVSCFSLLDQNSETLNADNTTVARLDNNVIHIKTNDNSIECLIYFPIIILKDNEYRQITINDATNASVFTHRLEYDKITIPLSYMSLMINNLQSDYITRSEDAFTFSDSHSNQFKFTY
ncbi:ODV-E66 [Perigonia lusca single nucleopolyhedrovirus]|uniref:ODV-E66 n=1 Tax=Perigonia lusca single nucleopolyhedrovirus TaxID=1675865 RepID=A0A0M3N137_9ABAC|nr:ODV-E66 [Perigonia lusca single nucleopolyhedrovirus]AKN80683.1 ODV-E66 [Perigonia lusca single nucleopolyhedrovirus]